MLRQEYVGQKRSYCMQKEIYGYMMKITPRVRIKIMVDKFRGNEYIRARSIGFKVRNRWGQRLFSMECGDVFQK